MHENEFEEKIREKMEQLKLVPTEEVWRKVSFDIQQEKRKKRFLFFLLFFTFLSGLTGLLLFINSDKNQRSTNNSAIKSLNRNKNPSSPKATDTSVGNSQNNSTSIEDTDLKKDRLAIRGSNIPPRANKMSAVKGIEMTKKIKQIEDFDFSENKGYGGAGTNRKSPEKTVIQNKRQEIKNPVFGGNSTTSFPLLNPSGNEASQLSDSLKQMKNNNNPPSLTDSVPAKQVVRATDDTARPAVAATKQTGKTQVQLAKKWRIGFTAFSGVSDNHSLIALTPVAKVNIPNSPIQSSAGATTRPVIPLSYKSGLTYGAGIYLQKALGKLFSFSGGLNYHVATATSSVGNANSSSQTFYDVGLQSSSTVNEYFIAGRSVTYRNKYHLMEMPLNLLIQLNKNKPRQLLLTAGVSPAYLVGSKALYANSGQNVYYTAGEQFNKWLFFSQAGIQLMAVNTPHFNIHAGPELRFGLNNMAKPATGTSQHLGSAAIKINVTLK